MPSAALVRWQTDRMTRLGHTDVQCAVLFGMASPPPLAQESLQAYVMLVSGHFQGFCRDLYSECSQICSSAVPAALRSTVQMQFASELRLNKSNPTAETLRKDFERFGFALNLVKADPANAARVTRLAHLNFWRNTIAHQKSTPFPTGMPSVLLLTDVQIWRISCDGLATSLDTIMRDVLASVLGAPPW